MKMKSKNAFTLVELLIAIVIIAASFTLVSTIKPQGQTAKREAERLVMLLEKTMAQAERTHADFDLIFDSSGTMDTIYIERGKENSKDVFIKASEGCSFKVDSSTQNRVYSAEHGTLSPGLTITVNGSDGSVNISIPGQGEVKIE